MNISDRSGSAFFAKVDSDREAGGRRRRRRAERGRNGRGSAGCACLALARKPGHPGGAQRKVNRWSEPGADQRHQPLPLDDRVQRKQRAGLILSGGSGWQAAPPLAAGLSDLRPPLAVQLRDRGERRHAAVVHLSDAAAMEATRKHESVPVRGGGHGVGDDDERCRLLRRLSAYPGRGRRWAPSAAPFKVASTGTWP